MPKFKWETEFKEVEIGEIPKEWEVEHLKWAVRSLESGNRPKGGKLKHDPDGILSIGGENITWQGDLVLDECLRFKRTFYEKTKRGKIEEQNILLVKDGATIGKLAFIKEIPEGKAMVNEHVFLIKTNQKNYNSRFLFYCLFSQVGQMQIESAIGGSAQGGINRSILNIIKIPKLKLSEQSRIAAVLSWFDDLIENKKRQNEILEKTAMAIFKNWFINFEPFKDLEFVDSELGKIPKGWKAKKVSEIFTPVKGKNYNLSQHYIEGYKPYLGVETYKTGIKKYWTEENEPFVDELDTVLIADGESSGKVFRYQKGVLGSTLLALKPKVDNKSLKHLIYLWLKSMESELMYHRTGTYIQHLDKDYLLNLDLLIPSDSCLNNFYSLVDPLFQKILLNQEQIEVLRKVRDVLLPLLVFGRLRVEEI